MSSLRSQSLYHGLADAMEAETPDTVVFCSPADPYFCVGYHQNAAEVLDLDLCRRQGWPVLRRKIGGGAVYLDQAQLFYQVIVHRSRAPFAVAQIYGRYLAAPVLALRRLGLEARLLPPNEIEVRGRRIAGTGGGQIGEAVVVVGNILFQFPDGRMARAWKAPSAPFRRLAREGLQRYLTTLAKELSPLPAMETVRDAVADAYAETLNRPLIHGTLDDREWRAIADAEAELGSEAFVLERGARPRGGLKIAAKTYVRECVRETPVGPLRLTVRLRGGVVDALGVSPARWRPLARAIEGSRVDGPELVERLRGVSGGTELVEALLTMDAQSLSE